jgi:Domain of unknown function (DUF4166)
VNSIYRTALGELFARRHPKMQEPFGFSSADRGAAIGAGLMDEIWHGPFYTLPFLYVGTWHGIMFPERGRGVPFTIRNYSYVDEYGRETVPWIRSFGTENPRRFDAYIIYSDARNKIVDYPGDAPASGR